MGALKHLLARVRDELKQHVDIVEHLRSVPEDEALAIIRRLRSRSTSRVSEVHSSIRNTMASKRPSDIRTARSLLLAESDVERIRRGSSLSSVVKSIEGGLLGRSPSLRDTDRAMLPPTETSLEFELGIQRPDAYQWLVPLDFASLDLRLLGITPFDASIRMERKSSEHAESSSGKLGSQNSPFAYSCVPHSKQLHTINPNAVSSSKAPREFSVYIDSRLARVEIRRWTNVAITNHLAADAISLYLKIHQPWWGLLDVDLFVDDLLSGRTKFCSQLLVNALLAWACVCCAPAYHCTFANSSGQQSYAYYDTTAAALSRIFLEEASQIYDSERKTDRLTTITAATLLCMTWTTMGEDKKGYAFMSESAEMAKRLRLFDAPLDDLHCGPLDLHDDDVKTAASAVAWGTFNFLMKVLRRANEA